jgi:hypothetical protein
MKCPVGGARHPYPCPRAVTTETDGANDEKREAYQNHGEVLVVVQFEPLSLFIQGFPYSQ